MVNIGFKSVEAQKQIPKRLTGSLAFDSLPTPVIYNPACEVSPSP